MSPSSPEAPSNTPILLPCLVLPASSVGVVMWLSITRKNSLFWGGSKAISVRFSALQIGSSKVCLASSGDDGSGLLPDVCFNAASNLISQSVREGEATKVTLASTSVTLNTPSVLRYNIRAGAYGSGLSFQGSSASCRFVLKLGGGEICSSFMDLGTSAFNAPPDSRFLVSFLLPPKGNARSSGNARFVLVSHRNRSSNPVQNPIDQNAVPSASRARLESFQLASVPQSGRP